MRTSKAMERMGSLETEGYASPSLPLLRVAVAITGSKNSALVIKWALDNFIPEGKVLVNLLHVRAPITHVPTTLGTYPVSQVHEDVVAAYNKLQEKQTTTKLLPFKQMCMKRKVQVYITVIEGDDKADAILNEISNSRITKLVIGASSCSLFTRKFKKISISSRIFECAPSFCAIYVVSKGNLSYMRPLNKSLSDAVHYCRSCSSSSAASSSSASIRQSGQGLASPPSGFSPHQKLSHRLQALSNLSTPAGSANNSNRPSLDVKNVEDILGSKFSDLTENGSKKIDKYSNLEDNGSRIFNQVVPLEPAKENASRTSDKGFTLRTSKNIGIRISDIGFTTQTETDSRSRIFNQVVPLEPAKENATRTSFTLRNSKNIGIRISDVGSTTQAEIESGSSSSDEDFNFHVVTDNTRLRLSDKDLYFDSAIDTRTRILSRASSSVENDLKRITDKRSILEASEMNGTEVSYKGPTLQVLLDNGSREYGKASTLEENGSRPSDKQFTFNAMIDTTRPRPFEENGSKVSSKGSNFGTALGTTRPMLPAKESTFEDKGPSKSSIKGFTIESATDNEWKIFDQSTKLEVPPSFSSLANEADIVFELEGLGIDRSQLNLIYELAVKETAKVSSQKQTDPSKHQKEHRVKPKKVTFYEDNPRELPMQENEEEEYEAVNQEEIEYQREWVEAEANPDVKDTENLDKATTILHSDEPWNMFTWEDIVSATSSFSDDLLIGMGAFGSVYKCKLHHTTTAVKILHSKESHWTKQFRQELEILSKIRHPHLVLLLGSCPDHGCLVYEYMERGSLEDRLLRKDNTTPIPWFERYRIAWEVASALVFLHNAKPKPIVHRDLKPANILLDHNYVSKIGDVGLSTKLPSDNATVFKETSPVGTLCYIDPEYQRTGMISPKSDVYAFGMVILQLLTAKPAIALTRIVENALENGRLRDILDSEAGNWPVGETLELATLGLSCTELRHCDRPDLKTQILPVLENLLGIAERARDSSPRSPLSPRAPSSPPQHFICPILQDVMDEPCVAADGYTYDRKAIDLWLKDNDNSPMTNLPLPSKNLLPNFTLLSAIMDWKSRK